FSTANASISGNSVVPGLPNMMLTPSCLSRSRNARLPDMVGKQCLPRFSPACAGHDTEAKWRSGVKSGRSSGAMKARGATIAVSQKLDRQIAFPGAKDVAGPLRIDAAGLEAYLAREVSGFQGPLTVRQFKGGQSNPTYFLETPARQYVLRRKPPG